MPACRQAWNLQAKRAIYLTNDRYKTIAEPAKASIREHASRFLAFAWPVSSEEQVREHLDTLRREFHDATHVCYAWRIGWGEGESSRFNDDGEPSGTAGRPILGQLLSRELFNVVVAVVRYFGGTKLGVPGLIAAYKQAAAEVLDAARVVERTVDVVLGVRFPYIAMNSVMRAVKELAPVVLSQQFDNECVMVLSIRCSLADILVERLSKCEGCRVESEIS